MSRGTIDVSKLVELLLESDDGNMNYESVDAQQHLPGLYCTVRLLIPVDGGDVGKSGSHYFKVFLNRKGTVIIKSILQTFTVLCERKMDCQPQLHAKPKYYCFILTLPF